MAPIAFIEWVEVLALRHSPAPGAGGVATATGVRVIETGQSVAGARHGDAVVAVDDRTSDGCADREGEGENSGETHGG
jgi:hypothetical protein